MNNLSKNVSSLILRELRSFKKEIESFPDEASVWRVVPGIKNSAGNLTLHVCGNLRFYIGNVLGKDGYTRNREAEFSTESGSRTDLIAEIDKTIEVVAGVLPALDNEILNSFYPEKVGGVELRTDIFIMNLAVHLGFHLGQTGYLRRAVTGDALSTSPVSLKDLSA